MQVVIVGAGYAGVACALRLALRSRGKLSITLVNARAEFVERIRLHQAAAATYPRQHALAELLRDTGVRLQVGVARELDLVNQRLRVGDETLRWDRLVLALGSVTDVDGTPGVREHAYTLEPRSAHAFAAGLPDLVARRARVVVIGGGLTGIETATELAEAHPELTVELVTRETLAPGFSHRAREHARKVLGRLGVAVREHVRVEALSPSAILCERAPIPYDAAIWAAGFRAPRLAAESGLPTNGRGQVPVDATLRVAGHPNVYVAGDLAEVTEGRAMPMGCKSALPTGIHVAENIARAWRGEPERRFAWRDVFFCVSLGRRDALVELPGSDLPGRRVWTGWWAAHVKEFICRGTLWALRIDRLRAAQKVGARSVAALPADAAA